MTTLLTDQSLPTVRDTIGQLLSAAASADLAVAHVRLAAVDLQPHETAKLQRLRLLLAGFDAAFAADAYALTGEPSRLLQLQQLLAFTESGRVEIRSMRAALWAPDFSIYRGLGGAQEDVLLLGAHYFRQLFGASGTALTCVLRDGDLVRRAARRFADLWDQADDIRPVIAETLRDALTCVREP
ncbi:MAG: hypothetical protein ACRENP_28840 [Longimicrobiales bacterium]